MFLTFRNVSGLRLIVKGKAECEFSEGSGNKKKRYTGKERYLNSVTYMFGSANADPVEVPVGVHTYNFENLLPEPLPYSVEGKKGFVRYKVVATLDIPWARDYETEKPFTVVRHDDLNILLTPNYREPVEVEEIKTFCCLFCESQPLIMTMRVPKTGFGLGDLIPIHVQMVNKSNNDVNSTELKLKKREHFNSTSPSRTKICSFTVTSKSGIGVRAGQTVSFEEYLEIPRVLSTSNSRYCKVFEIKYAIKFKAHTDGLGLSPNMCINIAIGNVGIIDGRPPGPTGIAPTLSPMQPMLPPIPQPSDDLRKPNFK